MTQFVLLLVLFSLCCGHIINDHRIRILSDPNENNDGFEVKWNVSLCGTPFDFALEDKGQICVGDDGGCFTCIDDETGIIVDQIKMDDDTLIQMAKVFATQIKLPAEPQNVSSFGFFHELYDQFCRIIWQ
jgi:hypothetical protein